MGIHRNIARIAMFTPTELHQLALLGEYVADKKEYNFTCRSPAVQKIIEEKESVIASYGAGMSHRKISDQYGVSRSVVAKILAGGYQD
jgi:DNA-binding transcriptional regulator LsrR (DeoR family)